MSTYTNRDQILLKTITDLDPASSLSDTDVFVIRQADGITRRGSVSQLKASGLISADRIGAANGIASLDGSSQVPINQIPNTIARTSDLNTALAASVTLTGAQTISGAKTFSNGLNVGTAGISFAVSGFADVGLVGYNRPSSTECGLSTSLLRCTGGRLDMNPFENKVEFRITGTSTQFNIYNTDTNQAFFTINSNRTVNLFNSLSVAGGVTGTGAGSFSSLSLSTALPITSGGTGANTASGARSAIGAASSGTNSDISSITGLTTPLSVAQGGTGANTLAGLRSTIGAAASGSNSDITALSGLTTALSISQGGTGATSAAGARTALGVAASGINSDITRLNGLSTSITVAQGGTGSSSASGARSNLGVMASRFVNVTGNYSILQADAGTLFDCSVSGGASTFTLPAAGSNQGFICTIRKTDSSANLITIAAAGADLINGAASIQLSQQFQAISLVCSGSNTWTILSNLISGNNAIQLQSRPVASTAPITGQSLVFDGTQWTPRIGGKILQVAYGFTSTQVSNTSSTYVDTGLNATITPLFTSSQILVIYSLNGCYKQGTTSINVQIRRDATVLTTVNLGGTGNASDLGYASSSNNLLTVPNSTSALNYRIFMSNAANSGTVFCQQGNSSLSSIVLLEVAA